MAALQPDPSWTTEIDSILASLDRADPEPRYLLAQFLAEQLVDCCRTFDGDLEQVLVLAVLVQRFLGARCMTLVDPERAGDMSWMAALRVADATGLPRETVRRKLMALERRQWVRHDHQKGWSVAGNLTETQVLDDLGQFEQRMQRRLLKLVMDLSPRLR